MWENRKDRVPIRRHPKNRSLIDTVKGVAAHTLDVDSMFVRDHRVWIVLLIARSDERLTVACRRYGWRDVRNIYSFGPNDPIERYFP